MANHFRQERVLDKQAYKSNCDAQMLNDLVLGKLSVAEQESVERHLCECESCAEQIQLAAVIETSWNATQSMLTPDEFDDPQRLPSVTQPLSVETERMSQSQTADVLTREIRGWLDPTDDPDSLGRFAGYEIVGIVGHGGMGIVLKGFECSLNRFVAIKVLAPRLATNGSARKRFAREARAAAAVRNENVIAIHRVDEWHSLPFLVMPYVGGHSLQKRIDSDGPMSIEQTLRVGAQIASGLAAAHAQGLVHRDIKPANILLEQGVERVTITDFGLARAADDASLTRTGVIAGTPQYMSPEQAEATPMDVRSDLFSLGSVLYAMATGRPPFRGEGSLEVLKKIVSDPARRMQEIEPSVPEWFERIVGKLHSKSPADRPSSADKVAQLLEQCLAHLKEPATTPIPELVRTPAVDEERLRRPPFSTRFVAALFAFAMVFAGVVLILEWNKGTLTIESEADNIPIRIMQDDQVIERLVVTQSGQSIRVAAGGYVVEVDGDFDAVAITNGVVSMTRRGAETVRIVQNHVARDAKNQIPTSGDDDDFGGAETDAATVMPDDNGLANMSSRPNSDAAKIELLLRQRAFQENATVSRQAIEEEVGRTAKKFGLTAEEYYRLLEKERGITAQQYRSQVVEPMLLLQKLAGDEKNFEGYLETIRAEAHSMEERATAIVMLMQPAELRNGNTIQRSAAVATLCELSANDFCGILRYTASGVAWLWEDPNILQIQDRQAELLAKVMDSKVGDLPDFDPALRMAYDALMKINHADRKMLVFTDGDPAAPDDATLQRFKDSGIPISVIHVPLHETISDATPRSLASATGGKYYRVNHPTPTVLSRIFRRICNKETGDVDRGAGEKSDPPPKEEANESQPIRP